MTPSIPAVAVLLLAASASAATFEAPASVPGVPIAAKPGWSEATDRPLLFLFATYSCQDGLAASTRRQKRCLTLPELHEAASAACEGHCLDFQTSTGKPRRKCGLASFAAQERCR